MGVEFTKEQQSVIDSAKCNLLVSAAAGSGKTAVLVERIIKKISSDLDVDRLLVVTFTRAAASQMKEKITDAIQKELAKDPQNVHLQRQETLIHSAQITTIDSFCQYVIRNNFNAIGLDPAFRVADEGELRLLQDDVLKEMIEEEYQRAKDIEDSDFLFCMDYFATGSRDSKVEEYIRQLYGFSMSMPWPEDWIRERSRDYQVLEADFDELPWIRECLKKTKRALGECLVGLDNAISVASDPDGPYMYIDTLEADKASIEIAMKSEGFDDVFEAVRGISFGRLPSKKDDSVSADKRDAVKELRDMVKDNVSSLIKDYFSLGRNTITEQMKLCDRAVRELCRLTLEFTRRLAESKRDKQVIDFSDMEHFALQILVDHPDDDVCEGKSAMEIIDMCTPSRVAMEMRDYYREVLIDEYQDSNSVQELILKAISGEKADISQRFMVGDVKQSIYKFRLARPEIFMEKFRSYSRDEAAPDRRIDLHKNFRSRSCVLDFTNYVFEKIMAQDLGGVAYDEDARLVPGAKYDEATFNTDTELMLVDESDILEPADETISELSPREKEALVIARRIRALRREDKDLKYSDIVILLRSLSGWDDVFKDILEREGIPCHTESKTGYFDAPEIGILLDMLSIIDNPRQDIPLIAVMHSSIGGFSDEELALLRIAIDAKSTEASPDSFYDGLIMDLDLDDELADRVKDFIASIEEYRVMATYLPVHELLWRIIDDTDYEVTVSAMPGGEQRLANVELLVSNAAEFEKTSFKGLFHFIRYIEHIKVVQVDYGEAGTIDENADVVRIMSIHKSKGLEFPVVFVSGLAKEFNTMDTKGDMILDMDLGIGVKCINSELRVKYDTLKRRLISENMKLDSLGEEIRVLYVGFTRAKEKLILTASVKDMGKTLGRQMMTLRQMAGKEGVLPYFVRSGAGSFLSLILPALMRHPSMGQVLDKYEQDRLLFDKNVHDKDSVPDLKITVLGEKDLLAQDYGEQTELFIRKHRLREKLETLQEDRELYKELKERFESAYPHESLRGLFTKTTVSELKKAHMEEAGEVFDNRAAFVEKAEKELEKETEAAAGEGTLGIAKASLTGAERGTAYHRIMELLDESIYGDEELMDKALAAGEAPVKGPVSDRVYIFMNKMARIGMIPQEYVGSVWSPDIASFLGSGLGQRMGRAYRNGKLMREKPFMMGVSASELDKRFSEDEMVLVQGIIDAWFIEDGEIVLLDYKTDRVDSEDELTERYRLQLELYKRALEASCDLKVKEVYIYSFALHKVIAL
jgi:ATP-dependent helicase/nuclease subunit A